MSTTLFKKRKEKQKKLETEKGKTLSYRVKQTMKYGRNKEIRKPTFYNFQCNKLFHLILSMDNKTLGTRFSGNWKL